MINPYTIKAIILVSVLLLLNNTLSAQFIKIPGAKGLDENSTTRKNNGQAWGDIDNDGNLDVIIPTFGTGGNFTHGQLFLNSGAPNYTFTDITNTHIDGFNDNLRNGRQMLIADFNNDGYNDILRGGGGTNIDTEIYYNDGPPNYTFGNASQQPDFLISSPPVGSHNTEGLVAIDWNQDGWLDIIADNDNGGNDVYENDQAGGFVYITAGTGPGETGFPPSHTGDGDYLTAADIDNDGYVDLYGRKTDVSNYWHFNSNTGQFETQPNPNIVSNESDKGGTMFCDFDNDGDLDLFWTSHGTNQIWRNDGGNIWVPTGVPAAPIANQTDIDGCDCGDVDNDGDLDIILGASSGNSYLLENTSTGNALSFTTINIATNVDTESTTFTDFDNDGDLDLYFVVERADNQLWENTTNNNNYLYVNAFYDNGNNSSRDAIGANVFLTTCTGDTTGIRQVNGGKGHGSQHQKKVHFGLDPNEAYMIEVHYVYKNGNRSIVRRAVIPSQETNQEITILDTDSDDISFCDPCNGINSSVTDHDSDGIGDICDLDDDNDGILDAFECPKPLESEFLRINPSDIDVSGSSTTNSVNATKDISAMFGLIPGSVIVSVIDGNTTETNGNTTWRVAKDSPNRFEITGTAVVFAQIFHGPGLTGNGDRDGFIALDNISYTVTTPAEPGFIFNNIGSNYFCEVADESISDGNQTMFWLSDNPISGIEFYTTNTVGFGSLVSLFLAACPDTDGDGFADLEDLDSDNDGCLDALEEEVSDNDLDGIAGVGTPIVDDEGLVTSIIYSPPPNNFWQNSLIGFCLPEICDDNIDNNANNYIDENDFECHEDLLDADPIGSFTSNCCSTCPEGDSYIIAPYWIGNEHSLKNLDNLAFNKPVYSSSRVPLSTAFFSVDNLFDNNKLAITRLEENPWVDIDLVGHFNINEINVYGQTNCCATTQYDYLVLLSEVPFPADNLNNILSMVPNPSQYTHSQQGGNLFSVTPSETARYIRVYLNGIGTLRISEIEVVGDVLPNSNPYDYDWGDPAIGNTPNPECLENGNYEITVTDRDTGASSVTTVNINI